MVSTDKISSSNIFLKTEQIWQGLPQKYIAIKNDTNPADHSQQVV